MLSISSPITSAAAVRYYVDLTNEDYITQGGEPMGIWFGDSARNFGLIGKVAPEQFKSVMAGFTPDRSQPMVQNAGDKNRQCGWDLTFSAPKSVSVLWSQGDAWIRREIEAAHLAAVVSTLTYLEKHAMWSRRGHAGAFREQVGMCAAIFQHGSSRSADPQIHSHVVVASVCMREDGTTGSILSKPLFLLKMFAGALYRAEFAAELIARLGLALVQQGMRVFEVAGVVGSLIRTFSKRSEEIKRILTERGEQGPEAARRATLSSRPAKEHFARGDLFGLWEAMGRQLKWSTEQARDLLGKCQPPLGPIGARDIIGAVKHLNQYQSHFTERDLLRALADQVQSKGYRLAQIEAAMRTVRPKLVPLGQVHGEEHFTTKGTLRMEKDFLSRVKNGAGSTRHLVRGGVIEKELASRQQLSEEQRAAVKYITGTAGSVKVVSGLAGTGKSTMLAAAREVWEKSGYNVIGASLTGKAAESLNKSAGIQSYTLASLLLQMNSPIVSVGRVTLASTQASPFWKTPDWNPLHDVRLPRLTLGVGKLSKPKEGPKPKVHHPIASVAGITLASTHESPFWKAPAWNSLRDLRLPHLTFGMGQGSIPVIGPKTIVVLDEAGLVGTRQMADLVDRLTAARAKVVLIGDRLQNSPIEAGAPFESLATRMSHATLTDIQRQKEPWAREMVKDLATGEVRKALDELNGRGRIHILQNKEETVSKLVDDWKSAGPARDNLILASTREEVAALNKAAQAKLEQAGELSGRPIEHRDHKFHVGDRVIFNTNSTRLGVKNGTFGQVSLTRGDDLIVRLDSDVRVTVSLDRYPDVSLGYALTGHRAQGLTCENSFSLISNDFAGREMGYVQASRARDEAHLYMERGTAGENLNGLEELFRPGRLKAMALDILQNKVPENPDGSRNAEGQESAHQRKREGLDPKHGNNKVEENKESKAKAGLDRKAALDREKLAKEEAKRQEENQKQREREERRQAQERERRRRQENERGR